MTKRELETLKSQYKQDMLHFKKRMDAKAGAKPKNPQQLTERT